MERPEIPAGLPADIEDKKAEARAWFEAAARPHLRRLRGNRGRVDRARVPPAAGPLRADALAARRRQGRRRHHVDDGTAGSSRRSASIPRRCIGEFSPEFRKQMPGAEEDPRFWASRHLADRASLESECAGRAHEHAHGRHVAPVVRRRRRPDAGARPSAQQDDPDTIAFHEAHAVRLRQARRHRRL